MKKFKKLLSCAAAATLAVTGIVGGVSLGANAVDDLITNGGPYTGGGTYIATYNSADYYHQTAFVLQFKYDVVGEPAAPQPNEPDLGYNDTFEFVVFDQDFGGWDRTPVGPTGYDLGVSYVKPVKDVVYTVEVPITAIESKLSTGKTPFGINIQTGAQLGTSEVTIVSLKYEDTEYVQTPFTITGNWKKGTASTMTVDPAGSAFVNANADNIIISAIDLSNWYNPTVEVTVTYAQTSDDFVQAEIALPTGETDPETLGEIYKTPDPNYVKPVAGEHTYVTEIPNTTTRFMAAYDQCTVTKIYVYDNNEGLEDNPVAGDDASVVAGNMGLAWNLGNALDLVDVDENDNPKVNEKATGTAKTTMKLIQAVKAAGFNTVKIPVSFIDMVGEDGDVNDDYIARIQQVVNYAYDMGMYSIVSLHSDGMPTVKGSWINIDATGTAFDDILNKYGALWTEVATAFAGYDQKVLFQAGSEFQGSAGNYAPPTQTETDNINTLMQTFVNAVRAAGGANTDRVLSLVGYLNNINYTIAGFKKPTDTATNRLMLCVNYYDPPTFTLGGFEGGSDDATTWDENGTYGKSYMNSQLSSIYTFARGLGMPVMIGEYGPAFKNNLDQITNYNYWLNYYAATYGIVTAYWDNGVTGELGTALFDRSTNTITTNGQAIVDAIVAGYNHQTYPTNPTP